MKIAFAIVLTTSVLGGCSMFGGSAKTCEVFSPAAIALPTTQNDQQVNAKATGDTTGENTRQQNCG